MSPYLAFIGLFLTFVVIPFSHYMIISDLNIGLLFLLSVTSLVVVSIIMGGWSSNSKVVAARRHALRSADHQLRAAGVGRAAHHRHADRLAVDAKDRRSAGRRAVALVRVPQSVYVAVAFFIWFISRACGGQPHAVRSCQKRNRNWSRVTIPNIPDFAFRPVSDGRVGEPCSIIGAVGTTLFMGGWRVPHDTVGMMVEHAHWWLDLVGFGLFPSLKDIAFIFVIIWIRWTLPRFRVDQMMNLCCWKYFIPGSFVCFVGVLGWAVAGAADGAVDRGWALDVRHLRSDRLHGVGS